MIMPESSLVPKRHPQTAPNRSSRCRVPPYAELHCRSNFSFLEGASHPDELIARAAELGYSACALTDRNSLAGVVRAHTVAKQSDLQLIIGAEIWPQDAPPVVLLATDRAAYGRLSRLITSGRRRVAKGACDIRFADIATYAEGLLAAVCGTQDIQRLHEYREVFGERGHLLAELHYGTDDQRRLDELSCLARQTGLPLVAAGDVYYHVPARMALQHVVTAIRHGTTVDRLGDALLPNSERHLRSIEELAALFSCVPDALQRTVEIAERCKFSLEELRYEYPQELSPPGETPVQYLRRLSWDGALRIYQGNVPKKVRQQLEHELGIIEELHYEAYFLTVYDIVQFARDQDPPILCQGRGSAANSTVCFCLEVTAVNPMEANLLFERFISRERNEAPDIDIDFEHERREEVLQYIYHKYGRERAGMTAEVITYRPRSAIRDVGKSLGLSLERVDTIAKNIDVRSEQVLLASRCQQSGLSPESQIGKQLLCLVNDMIGFPRHLSQHVGGMVITERPLCEIVPIENASMDGRTAIEWDKNDLDELGILKIDCLGLGMLSAIHRCFDLIEKHYEPRSVTGISSGGPNVKKYGSTASVLSLNNIPDEDSDVYDMIGRADTIGVFQIESRAQMSMLPRMRPQNFYDLVIEVAIVRPGPIQGSMVHPYLRRRNGEEPATYPNEEIYRVLQRTLGVPLFQEQAMQLAMVAAGFTPGEADQLRRAMGAWRRPGVIDQFHCKLVEGMLCRGYSQTFAENLFLQIRSFGEYGFPESHAASFAKLVYISAWLKHYFPAAFTAALLNSQPMGFYAPAQLIQDVRKHGVEVLPVDVNYSDWNCTLEVAEHACQFDKQEQSTKVLPKLRLGMRLIRGLQRVAGDKIVASRTSRYRSIGDLATRTHLNRRMLECLAEADAFQSLSLDRRSALWQTLGTSSQLGDLPLFAQQGHVESPTPSLPKLTRQEEVTADYRMAGLTLREHPLSFCREKLNIRKVVPARSLADYQHHRRVRVAGLVLMRQSPSTAKGVTFVTLEDETGIVNLIIHQTTWKRYDAIARRARGVVASGRLEREHDVIHVVVSHLESLDDYLKELQQNPRNFR